MTEPKPVWLRGPVEGVPALLQPAAHAALEMAEELEAALKDVPDTLLWTKPHGVASIGFHLKHIPGVLDRMMTYAQGEQLSPLQRTQMEEEQLVQDDATIAALMKRLRKQVSLYVEQLKQTDPATLDNPRGVGRLQLPSTVGGLICHAAEHTQRHTGQLLVTIRVQTGTQ